MRKRFLSAVILLATPAFATFSQLQSNAAWNTSGTSCTVALTNTHLGNLLVVWATWSPSNLSASVGDTLNSFPSAVGPTVQPASNTAAQIFYAKNINGTSSDNIAVSFSGTATTSCVAVEYSGADQNSPLDSVSAGYSTVSNPTNLLDSGNVAPANSNLLVFGGGISDGGTLILGANFSLIQKHSVGTGGAITENNIAISGNSALQRATACIGSGSTCSTTPGNWLMQMAIFRDASWTVGGGWSLVRPYQVPDASQFPGTDACARANTAFGQVINNVNSMIVDSRAV